MRSGMLGSSALSFTLRWFGFMASKLGPPCPGCGQCGRRNEGPGIRADKKFRCVNQPCYVLLYSFQDSLEGERFRQGNAALPPVIASHKVPQLVLGLDRSTSANGTPKSPTATGAAATNAPEEGTHGQKPAA